MPRRNYGTSYAKPEYRHKAAEKTKLNKTSADSYNILSTGEVNTMTPMTPLNWNDDEYSVRIEKIDEHHMKLIELLNQLHEAHNEEDGQSKVKLILGELKSYTRYHFALEEKLMQAYDFSGLEDHKKKHDYFKNYITELEIECVTGNRDVTAATTRLLGDWVDKHIKGMDMEYTEHLNNNGVF